MSQQTIVGLYATPTVAQEVRTRLEAEGVPSSDISIRNEAAPVTATTPTEDSTSSSGGGFWDWLFGSEASTDERDRYAHHLRSGLVAVSVRVGSEGQQTRIIDVMEQFDPVDLDNDASTAGSTGLGSREISRTEGASSGAGGMASDPTGRTGAGAGTDEVVPLSKEELAVGKRQVERRYRVRTHIVERPVEAQVNLRDERVTIERRAAPDSARAGEGDFQDKDVEIVERREEPVITKTKRADEEIVVRRDVSDRAETVRDTVRETKVDIDRPAAREGEPAPASESVDPGLRKKS
jgi:stress response protein YsnF